MNYIDIHGHINFPEYDVDRDEVIKRAHDAGVGIVVVGTDIVSSNDCVKLAEGHDHMWAVVGLHPTETDGSRGDEMFDIPAFTALAKHDEVVAIGECGLEYSGATSPGEMAIQEKVFIQHIEVANSVGKPLMLHVRNIKRKIVANNPAAAIQDTPNAYADAIQILKDHAKVPADFHFFSGSKEDMENVLAAGCSISFTGVITFTRDYDELIRSVPLEKILTETDCPFVSPIPYRGQRNEPVYVIEVVKQIAKIRGEDEAKVAKQLLQNAKQLFGI